MTLAEVQSDIPRRPGDAELIGNLRTALAASQQRITLLEIWLKQQGSEATRLQSELREARAEIGRLTRALDLAGVGIP